MLATQHGRNNTREEDEDKDKDEDEQEIKDEHKDEDEEEVKDEDEDEDSTDRALRAYEWRERQWRVARQAQEVYLARKTMAERGGQRRGRHRHIGKVTVNRLKGDLQNKNNSNKDNRSARQSCTRTTLQDQCTDSSLKKMLKVGVTAAAAAAATAATAATAAAPPNDATPAVSVNKNPGAAALNRHVQRKCVGSSISASIPTAGNSTNTMCRNNTSGMDSDGDGDGDGEEEDDEDEGEEWDRFESLHPGHVDDSDRAYRTHTTSRTE
jgi:hypothetical protein